jgi:hypothetical protein
MVSNFSGVRSTAPGERVQPITRNTAWQQVRLAYQHMHMAVEAFY